MSISLVMQQLKKYLESDNPAFEGELRTRTSEAKEFAEVLQLCTIRKRALAKGLLTLPGKTHRVAMVGGANMRPLVDFNSALFFCSWQRPLRTLGGRLRQLPR